MRRISVGSSVGQEEFRMNTHSGSGANERVLDDRDPDYWGMILDLVPPVLRAWKIIVVATIAAGALAYFIGLFNVSHPPKVFTSMTYIGPLDAAKATYAGSVLRSVPVMKIALEKFANYPVPGTSDRERGARLASAIQFFPAMASDPKQPSLYVLAVSDSDPARAQAIASSLIDAWLATTKPQPEAAARLGRLLKATETQISDLSTLINELLKHPELLGSKPGNMPADVASLIKLRADSMEKVEGIKSELAGIGADVIFSPPTMPDKSVPDAPGLSPWRAVLKAMGVTFAALLVIVLLRHIVLLNVNSPIYGSKMKRICQALPWRRARKSVS
ncbi:hypothetical protein V4R08_01260 [Nitrobacter sp. NHB1]|uniref:hypothetical protein n=1 Tax=Nitrobacter sp. NHB1 TaxID=3119830 RepID=UPI003000BBFE